MSNSKLSHQAGHLHDRRQSQPTTAWPKSTPRLSGLGSLPRACDLPARRGRDFAQIQIEGRGIQVGRYRQPGRSIIRVHQNAVFKLVTGVAPEVTRNPRHPQFECPPPRWAAPLCLRGYLPQGSAQRRWSPAPVRPVNTSCLVSSRPDFDRACP